MHGHIHSPTKQRLNHRLNIIQGQIEGLKKLVEKETYCVDVLIQSLAVQKSLKSFDALMLDNHLQMHAWHQLSGKEKDRAVKELLNIYKLSRD